MDKEEYIKIKEESEKIAEAIGALLFEDDHWRIDYVDVDVFDTSVIIQHTSQTIMFEYPTDWIFDLDWKEKIPTFVENYLKKQEELKKYGKKKTKEQAGATVKE
jgi:hypothetical protein